MHCDRYMLLERFHTSFLYYGGVKLLLELAEMFDIYKFDLQLAVQITFAISVLYDDYKLLLKPEVVTSLGAF